VNRSLKRITIKNLASIIGKQLNKYDIDAVLTGGACVTVFSGNMYVSSDLDFVSSATVDMPRVVKKAMEEIGFARSAEGYFRNPDCPYFIEFISSPLAVGNEPPKKVIKMKTRLGSFRLLSPTDCVKDRLAAYFHWDDLQSLEQAVLVAKNNKIDLHEIKRWSKAEGHSDKYNAFLKQLK
jgi:hypothetical protein